MKRFFIIAFALLWWNIFDIAAQDLVILRDGNVIEARVTEISPTEIRYKRFNHLNGPVIVIARGDVLSIRYENGTTEIINSASAQGQRVNQPATPVFTQSGEPNPLQQILNSMPAIRIAGNNLKFEFTGDTWIAKVNGENFSVGTIEVEATDNGAILTLKQTHIWPGAAGRTAGRVANVIPGGGAAGSALNTAGNIAEAAGPIETSGTIVLEYKAGPPSSLKLVSSSQDDNNRRADRTERNSLKSANARNNWISAELAFDGIGARYERMLNKNISLGVNFYYGHFFYDWEYIDINVFIRAYPWGKTFFLGLGFGYNRHNNDYYPYYVNKNNSGFTIVPEMGWKIDPGEAGGFYLTLCLTCPLIFGDETLVCRFGYLGMGFAF